MINLSAAQLDLWMAGFLFPLARIMGLIATAPILSNRAIPARIRMGFGAAMTLALIPALPPSGLIVGSWPGLLALLQQMLIGIALGFSMRVVFTAIDLAGELIGLQMGLGFAMFYDPDNAAQSPVISEFLGLLAMLIFLSINGHLMLLAVIGNSFEWWPVGADLFPANGWMAIARWGSTIFSAGVMLALPVIAALLVVNIALAVLTRAAPTLNLFAIGFPVTLIAGFVMLLLSMPFFAPALQQLFDYGLRTVAQLAMG
ncbi:MULTISPECIES: flagellar biosynthetic protein FliR [Methyloversatilis]|uniref:flagellar biosynthetic protein FliR n=1 Tax=Methyloversatilis TaxID=378210 RepID=UPI000DB2F2C0|nr:flagellar biosynthetic protein FliR [Methyloversatilis sp.]MCR6665810.1 flagellar biosynthetic protein FliR [Methyloversatilis sp.]PZU52252.1 MAG: flagellar biosynthetic protein FliR [Thauera sp.]